MSDPIHDRGLRVRPATPADFAVVQYLEDAIFSEDPWTAGMIEEELSSPTRAYFIAERATMSASGGSGGVEESTEILGYGGISLGLDADIMTVGVMPNARRDGVGSQLVEALLAAAHQAGTERVFLEVRESNSAAQGLYERYGFERIGRVRSYFRHPVEDAITMRLDVLSESGLT